MLYLKMNLKNRNNARLLKMEAQSLFVRCTA